jgi:PBP1b-binding outer membrane lipoprotein LpoB
MKRLLSLLAAALLGLSLSGCVSTTTTTYGPAGQAAVVPAGPTPV